MERQYSGQRDSRGIRRHPESYLRQPSSQGQADRAAVGPATADSEPTPAIRLAVHSMAQETPKPMRAQIRWEIRARTIPLASSPPDDRGRLLQYPYA